MKFEDLKMGSIAVAGASGTSGNVVQTSLVSGANTVQVVVTAEDGTTTKTYEVTVTRETPKSDSTLSSLSVACAPLPTNIPPSYQTAMDSALPSCWLSKTPEGGIRPKTGTTSSSPPPTRPTTSGLSTGTCTTRRW